MQGRAEFTMYNGLAVVFLVSAVCYLVFTPARDGSPDFPDRQWNGYRRRGRTTRDTFEEAVRKFAAATAFKHHCPTS
jgi:hypothetical protein